MVCVHCHVCEFRPGTSIGFLNASICVMNEFACVCYLPLHVRSLVLLNALPLWKVCVRVTHAVRTWGLRVGYSMEPLCFGDWHLIVIVSLGPWLLIMAARLGTISTFGSQQHWFEHMYFRVHYLYSSYTFNVISELALSSMFKPKCLRQNERTCRGIVAGFLWTVKFDT